MPLPLESEFPDLGEAIRQIANRQHPTVKRLYFSPYGYALVLKNGQVKRKVLVQRNDPCPCGSGRKFKKCCG